MLWLAALAVDYLGPVLSFRRDAGWEIAAGHFAERHGLIVIIALGESIVAVGVGVGVGAMETELTTGVVVAALLGMAIAACLWWAYFDVVAVVSERKLHEVKGQERARQARDSYSYLHFPMIAGIVLLALGIKKTIARVDHPLDDVAAVCLCGGFALYLLGHFALYLLGHIGFRLRNVRSLNRQRAVAIVALLAVILAVLEVDAIVALAIVAAIGICLITYEARHFAEARREVRSAI